MLATASGQRIKKVIDPNTKASFRYKIHQQGTVFWSNSTVRDSVQSLADARSVPIWLDRRCDPTEKLNLVSQATLRESLWLAGEQTQFDFAWAPEIVVIAPEQEANRWATTNVIHRRMLSKLPRAQRTRWLREKSWSWPRLTNPQDLLKQLEQELGHEIQGREMVLRDLWPANKLPPLPLYMRLELLLLGYSKTFEFDDQSAAVRPLPKSPRFAASVSTRVRSELPDFLANHPGAKLDDQNKLVASWHTHEQLRMKHVLSRKKRTDRGKLRYTLRAKDQPVGAFVEQLAKQLQLKADFSAISKSQREQMISFRVENATIEELLDAILSPAGFAFKLDGDQITVSIQNSAN